MSEGEWLVEVFRVGGYVVERVDYGIAYTDHTMRLLRVKMEERYPGLEVRVLHRSFAPRPDASASRSLA